MKRTTNRGSHTVNLQPVDYWFVCALGLNVVVDIFFRILAYFALSKTTAGCDYKHFISGAVFFLFVCFVCILYMFVCVCVCVCVCVSIGNHWHSLRNGISTNFIFDHR